MVYPTLLARWTSSEPDTVRERDGVSDGMRWLGSLTRLDNGSMDGRIDGFPFAFSFLPCLFRYFLFRFFILFHPRSSLAWRGGQNSKNCGWMEG